MIALVLQTGFSSGLFTYTLHFAFITNLPLCFFFFLNDTAPTEIYTLPLHAPLPILDRRVAQALDHPVRVPRQDRAEAAVMGARPVVEPVRHVIEPLPKGFRMQLHGGDRLVDLRFRSEEHTSELQSQSNLVCRLLLAK